MEAWASVVRKDVQHKYENRIEYARNCHSKIIIYKEKDTSAKHKINNEKCMRIHFHSFSQFVRKSMGVFAEKQ